ncbi:MAG: hypothetical protein HQL64_07685 [Magnetococcales bacterium]|nr:hypothetical protein [Magnetococcales bacterium]
MQVLHSLFLLSSITLGSIALFSYPSAYSDSTPSPATPLSASDPPTNSKISIMDFFICRKQSLSNGTPYWYPVIKFKLKNDTDKKILSENYGYEVSVLNNTNKAVLYSNRNSPCHNEEIPPGFKSTPYIIDVLSNISDHDNYKSKGDRIDFGTIETYFYIAVKNFGNNQILAQADITLAASPEKGPNLGTLNGPFNMSEQCR